MTTNELKKGTHVKLRHTGWEAVLMDNKKGNIRMADVYGICHEMGSVYAHDIVLWHSPVGGWLPVEHTEEQKKLRLTCEAF